MTPEKKPSLAVRLLSGLAGALNRHPGWFVWPQLLLFLACVAVTVLRLEFDLDRNALVGEDKPSHKNFLAMRREFPSQDDLATILELTTGARLPTVEAVCTGEQLREMQKLARDVAVAPEIRHSIARLIRQTHPLLAEAPEQVRKYVRYGSSPRGAQSILLAAKARALAAGRLHVSLEDVQAVAMPCLRHRVLPSFEGEAEGVGGEMVLKPLIDSLQVEVKA